MPALKQMDFKKIEIRYLAYLTNKGDNMDKGIKEVLMERDGMTDAEATFCINQAKADLQNRLENPADYDSAHDICMDHFGLEPDYIFELMPY